MKTYKRILAVILCVVMTLTAAPLTGLVSLFAPEAQAKDISGYAVGDIIEFGSYPQSEVTDQNLKTELLSHLYTKIAAGESQGFVSYGYYSGTGDWDDGQMKPGDFMKYADVTYGGEKYRGVMINSYRPYLTGYTCSESNSYQDENGYTTGNIYWFKYEPLRWCVLDPAEGFILCESVIDAQPYSNVVYYNSSASSDSRYRYFNSTSCTNYASDYETSSIRAWLNDDFYNTAFTSAEKALIGTTTLDNSWYYNPELDSATTHDKIFLLSYDEARNAFDGFSNGMALSSTRDAKWTAYAHAQGGYSSSGNFYFWLRSGDDNSYRVYIVYSYDNNSSVYGQGPVTYTIGIRPALKFNPGSEIFESEYSQVHTVADYKESNAGYAAKYFTGAAQPMDGSNGTPDLCIPGLSLGENMVPQGIAYYPAKNWLLVSSYYKDAETDSYPCYIYALDFTTGKMVAEYKLKEAESSTLHGHVGGIAVSNHNLYVTTDDSSIGYAPLSDLDKMNGEIIIREHTSMSEWLGNANTAYLSINDGVLITGNFFYAKDSKYDTPAKAANSVILAQNLSGNSSEQEWKNFCNSGPFAVVEVPDSVDRIQGVVYRDEKFFISSSLGRRNTSSLIIADIDKSNGYTLKNITKHTALPMMEGITFVGDYIYSVFESASAFYQKGLDGKNVSLYPTDVVWKIDYKELIGVDDTPTVTGDVEDKYVEYLNGDNTGFTYLTFKQNWFAENSGIYNHSLGRLCSQFVMLGYDKAVADPNRITLHEYTKPNLKTALETIGMTNIEIDGYTAEDEVNTFIAHRTINVNGEEFILVFAGFIGSQDGQWYNNFDPGTGVTHQGFNSAKNHAYGLLEAYIQRHGFDKSKTKILLTGHSRGAATSNLVAAQLIKDEKYATAGNIYTYAFATPNSTSLDERNNLEYKRIFNIVNPEDFVTKVLPTAWGFGRYGTTYTLPSKTNTSSSQYQAYKTNMQHYFGAFTDGQKYEPYIAGENATYCAVSSLTQSVKDINKFYSVPLWAGITPVTAHFFFQNTLCHFVSHIASPADYGTAAILILETLSTVTSSSAYREILNYFVLYSLSTKEVEISGRFSDAHRAETYCAYMMSMSETQIKQQRKGYLNTVNCPVDVEVIDNETGEVVGRIVDNVVDEEIAAKENAVVMSVDGDSKSFWLPSDGDYEVRLIGNGEGTMDYTVAEIDSDLGETERINFFDVEITDGKEMTGDVPAEDFVLDEYTLKTDSSEETPDQKLDAESGEITITTSVEGDGYVTESFNVKSGDYVTVSAQPFVTAKFVKWVDSNCKTLSTDAEYSFVAKENTSIKAVFTTASGIIIKTPSTTTVNYGDTLILHADFGEVVLPEGYSILWTVEGSGFNMAPAADGLTCKMTSVANGNATVKATLVDKNGEAVLDADGNEMSDTQELKSNAGFWQKIVSFFKNLFRISRIILQSIDN